MVLADSHGVSLLPCYSGFIPVQFFFQLQDFYLLWFSFQLIRLTSLNLFECPSTPIFLKIGLGFAPFARRYSGYRFCFLFLWLLRCFSSPSFPTSSYLFTSVFLGSPIRILPALCLLPAPRNFSLVATSFFVSVWLGIRR